MAVEDTILLGERLGIPPHVPPVGVLGGDSHGSLLSPTADEQWQPRLNGLGLEWCVDELVVLALAVVALEVASALLEKTGGMELMTELLSTAATEATIIPFLAFVIGLISAYSSTSGVVLPAFLPTVPGLVESLGGGLPLALASTMNVAGHLVDVSPERLDLGAQQPDVR